MVVDILRRIAGLSGKPEVDEALHVGEQVDFDEIVAKLQIVKLEVDRLKDQLVNDINAYYDKMLAAAKKKDHETAELSAAEIVLKKRVLKAVMTYSKLLSIAIARINDARSIDSLVKALAPLEYAMKAMDEYLATISPETAAKLSSIIESTERFIRSTSIVASSIPMARSVADLDPEVKREIARVMTEVQREAEDIALEAPPRSDDPGGGSLEDKLLDYIRRSGGVIRVSRAAKDLGVGRDDIIRALRRLHERGLIRLSKEAQAQ